MKCDICNSESDKIFNKRILMKYDVNYYYCKNCGLVQVEEPYWLDEAYSDAIATTDVGLVKRNMIYSNLVQKLIEMNENLTKGPYLDYAGGYGLFVRIMRDKGYDFYRQDKYCKNIFSTFFDYNDFKHSQYNLVTAFEFLEHTNDINKEFSNLFNLTNTVVFSTFPYEDIHTIHKWWYLSVETGQHIHFFHRRTLKFIADKYNKNFFDLGHELFALSDLDNISIHREIKKNRFLVKVIKSLSRSKNESIQIRTSLTESDYKHIKEQVIEKQ